MTCVSVDAGGRQNVVATEYGCFSKALAAA